MRGFNLVLTSLYNRQKLTKLASLVSITKGKTSFNLLNFGLPKLDQSNMSFAGKYEMVSSEGFDDYLKAVGVGMVTRKLANSAKPTIEITEDGDKINMKTITTFKTIDLSFTCGQEFLEETADGRKVKTTINKDGNKLIQVQKLDGLEAHITRTFNGNELVAEFTAGGVTSKRVYKKA